MFLAPKKQADNEEARRIFHLAYAKVQVLFKGKPLSNALIDAYSLVDHSAKEQAVKTDSEGKATFKFDVEGPVILNTVWGVPLTNSSAADFETYFSSLTFEYFQSPTK